MELKCHGIGTCTADAELRPVGQTSVCTVNLAFNRSYKDKENQWQQETSFVKAQIFGPRAEKLASLAKKGTPVYAEGYIKQDSWTDKEGQKKTVLVLNLNNFDIIQKLNGEAKAEKSTIVATTSPPKNKAKKSSPEPQPAVAANEIEDDDQIPF